MMALKKVSVLFFLLIIVSGELKAQNQFKTIWTPVSALYKGFVTDIAFDSSGCMFICADKMYVSSDSGKTGDIYLDKKVLKAFVAPDNYIYVSTAEGLLR